MLRCMMMWFGLIISGSVLFNRSTMASEVHTQGWDSWQRMPWGWIGMIVAGIVGLIIFLVILFLVFQKTQSSTESLERGTETPLEILQKRYARGEISREEYLKIKQDLTE